MSRWYSEEDKDAYRICYQDNNGIRTWLIAVWKGPHAAQLPQPTLHITDHIVTYLNSHDNGTLDVLSAKQKDRLLAEAINWIARELFGTEKNISHD